MRSLSLLSMLIGHYLERLLACLHCPGRELSIERPIHALVQAVKLVLRPLASIMATTESMNLKPRPEASE